MSDDTAMLKLFLDDAYAEIEELGAELERLTAMVAAAHTHEWVPDPDVNLPTAICMECTVRGWRIPRRFMQWGAYDD